MIWIDSHFFLVMLGWSIFAPFVFLFVGWWAHEQPEEMEKWW